MNSSIRSSAARASTPSFTRTASPRRSSLPAIRTTKAAPSRRQRYCESMPLAAVAPPPLTGGPKRAALRGGGARQRAKRTSLLKHFACIHPLPAARSSRTTSGPSARPLHEAGNYRAFEQRSHRQASWQPDIPGQPRRRPRADRTLTPQRGTRSSVVAKKASLTEFSETKRRCSRCCGHSRFGPTLARA